MSADKASPSSLYVGMGMGMGMRPPMGMGMGMGMGPPPGMMGPSMMGPPPGEPRGAADAHGLSGASVQRTSTGASCLARDYVAVLPCCTARG
jgi:hypothetical protein